MINFRFFMFISLLTFKVFTDSSSVSDYDAYKNVCITASKDDHKFKIFKRDPAYNAILEHVSCDQGLEYFRLINGNKKLMSFMNDFRGNDVHGSPRKMSINGIGLISPTTIRYIKVLNDLINQLGSLDDLNIVEIGGGYGGQCLILSKMFKFNSYTIIDLTEPLQLAKKYLNVNKIKNVNFIDFCDLDNQSIDNFDFLISNYAFTECNRNIQDMYFEKVIAKAKKGYITANAESWSNCYNTREIVYNLNKWFSSLKILPEEPLTAPGNCILIW